MKKLFYGVCLLIACVCLLPSCGGDDDMEEMVPPTASETFSDRIMYSGDTYTLPSSGAWRSSNERVAKVSDGQVIALTLGTARIYDGTRSFYVTVKARYNLYREPCLTWGASLSSVQSFMSDYTYVGSTSGVYTYAGRDKEYRMFYQFTSGSLAKSEVYLRPRDVSSSVLTSFLTERYIIVDVEDNYTGMVTPNLRTLVVFLYDNGGYYDVIYAPESSSRCLPTPDVFARLVEAYRK